MSRFEIGTVKLTDKAKAVLADAGKTAKEFLDRHAAGDWGVCLEELKLRNEKAITDGGRIQGVYELRQETIWVVTEGQPPVTTISVPIYDNRPPAP